MACIFVNANRSVGTINPNIYGQFSEHLGRCIYQGIYVGQASDIPNTNGMRNDVVSALKALHVPVLRWPGGCFADTYHWRDGIGPKENRKTIVNTNWGGVTEDNSFGTHEFMELCRQIGCEAYFSGNVGSGTVQEFSDWVEYCNMGGIVGAASFSKHIENCFSSMVLTGKSKIGGIVYGAENSAVVENCYYTGSITSTEGKASGLIAGGSHLTITNCYWSKECNMTIDGLPDVKRGVGTDVSEDPTTGLTLTEMRTKASYAGWDFDTIWAIDTNKNGGLPYLRWQDDVPTVIEPTSLTLSAETVTLAAGRSTTLTAVFSPIGAGGKPTWSSDAPDVASVTAGGQVAAHRAGTAIITASYGSLQASCSVTVTERRSDEYTIREITLKDASGKAVTGIPSDSFWAYVSVTKGANAKDATVLLASYDRNGQYLGLTALEADVPCGTTYRLGAWFANADRRVAKVKAFVVDGVGTMRPLAAAAEIS